MSYTISTKNTFEITLNEDDPVRSVLQNISIILSTWQNSVPLYRDFGISTEFIDKPVPAAKPLLIASIKEAIEKYEPRATILSVTFDSDNDTPGKITPVLEVEINDE